MNNAKEIRSILQRAFALVKRGWTRGVDARDKKGIPINCKDRGACQWCARGAIRKADGGSPHCDAAFDVFLVHGLPSSTKCRTITGFNDTTDKETVLAAFRRAIKACK